jgi:UDP:flavonoid glycosyltransferase YjiC (YdhE family)
MPEFADQRFWARRMNDLGVGPPAFPRRKLSAEHLADVIRRVTTDSRMRERAATLAERIRAEDGVTRAVEAFGAYVGVGGRRA